MQAVTLSLLITGLLPTFSTCRCTRLALRCHAAEGISVAGSGIQQVRIPLGLVQMLPKQSLESAQIPLQVYI